ncbi:MAG TPA: NIPSNAP family protein [Allosphingosinicella sp.]|nr:NIPSNAP family protein [Allosphingosinicella sp.]
MSVDRRDLLVSALAAGSLPLARAIGAVTTNEGTIMLPPSRIVELRQYTLHPGAVAEFTRLFEREFIVSQEALGIRIVGIFRDLDDPDRFVWLRGFETMEARGKALPAFYSGPVWHAHGKAANSKMLDSDNVLPLRPAGEGGVFAPAVRTGAPGVILAAVHYLNDFSLAPFASFFAGHMAPDIAKEGAHFVGTFVTETSPNNFPSLPVREADRVFVWLARFPNEAALDLFIRRFHRRSGWREGVAESLLPAFARKPELIRLAPSHASSLR